MEQALFEVKPMPAGKMIETERLILRPIVESDEKDIFEYAKNPNVGTNAGWKPHENMDETREILKTVFLNKENVFGIVIKETGKLVGTIGITEDLKRSNDRVLMLGYSLGEDCWGLGYATEAAKAIIEYGFQELKLDMISVYCYSYNSRSRRVIKKLGFSYEGTLSRCERRFDGKVLDVECYALGANDFLNGTKGKEI